MVDRLKHVPQPPEPTCGVFALNVAGANLLVCPKEPCFLRIGMRGRGIRRGVNPDAAADAVRTECLDNQTGNN